MGNRYLALPSKHTRHMLYYIAILLALKLMLRSAHVVLRRYDLRIVIHYSLYSLLAGYICYYIGYCVFDSSKGNIRAPNIAIQHIPDRDDLISQILYLLGATALCLWPAALYYGLTQKTNMIFWLLLGCSLLPLPMALQRSILFCSLDALNPVTIAGSIARTLPAYCGLILALCLVACIATAASLMLQRMSCPQFLINGLNLYWLLIAAHLIGRFYYRYRNMIDWGL